MFELSREPDREVQTRNRINSNSNLNTIWPENVDQLMALQGKSDPEKNLQFADEESKVSVERSRAMEPAAAGVAAETHRHASGRSVSWPPQAVRGTGGPWLHSSVASLPSVRMPPVFGTGQHPGTPNAQQEPCDPHRVTATRAQQEAEENLHCAPSVTHVRWSEEVRGQGSLVRCW